MHIPDGMLDTKTWATMWAGAAGGIGYAGYWINKKFDRSKIVLMAVFAALIFGLQMLNFPIAAGTSGHFGGGVAAGIVLGPWPACIVMSAVLLVQAVFFGDGGITALGANIVNMGIIAPFVGYLVYQAFLKIKNTYWTKVSGAFFASLIGVVVSSAAVALELWTSNHAQFFVALGAMISWHALIGIGEGVITAGLVAYIAKVRPQILDENMSGEANSSSFRSVSVVIGILALIAAGISFLASSHPDGLEYVYFDMGIGKTFAEASHISSPLPDYVIPGLTNETLAGVGAGIIGVIITGVLLWAILVAIKRRKAPQSISPVLPEGSQKDC